MGSNLEEAAEALGVTKEDLLGFGSGKPALRNRIEGFLTRRWLLAVSGLLGTAGAVAVTSSGHYPFYEEDNGFIRPGPTSIFGLFIGMMFVLYYYLIWGGEVHTLITVPDDFSAMTYYGVYDGRKLKCYARSPSLLGGLDYR